jgi:hypothetical protein
MADRPVRCPGRLLRGYYFAYQGIFRVDDGSRLSGRQLRAVVVAGFGGLLTHGGGALDKYALQAAGADEKDAKARATALPAWSTECSRSAVASRR